MTVVNTMFTLQSPEIKEVDSWHYPQKLILKKTHYSTAHNVLCVQLCTQHENLLTWFAQTYFRGLEPKLMNFHREDGTVYACDKFFESVLVDGNNARQAIDNLFKSKLINDNVRSEIENPLKAFEQSLANSQKVKSEITNAQRELLESFVEPYLEVLMENFNCWKLDAAISAACECCCLDQENFHSALEERHISRNNDDDECVPIIEYDLEEGKKREITESFYMISRVLKGIADLEGALLQRGPNLPSLDVQKNVILALLK